MEQYYDKNSYRKKSMESVRTQLLKDNVYLLGIHLFLSIPYVLLSPHHMAIINIFSIIFYLGCFIFLKKSNYAPLLYSYLILVEIMIHDIFCVLIFGWACEFQLWIITLISTFIKDYITPDKSEKHRKRFVSIIVGIGLLTFISLYFVTKYVKIPISDYPSSSVVSVFVVINSIIGFAGMSAFTTIFVQQMEYKYTQLHRLADYDQLTGLGNRYNMLDILAEEEKKSTSAAGYSVAMIDIDFFKKVNDTYGHNNGDIVLSDLANLLSFNLPEGIHVGRWGGEEFLVISDYQVNYSDFLTLLEQLRQRVSSHVFVFGSENTIHCTISLGAAKYEEGLSIQDVIQHADDNLYKAKKTGRNRLVAS